VVGRTYEVDLKACTYSLVRAGSSDPTVVALSLASKKIVHR
jgi:hypothetical protein